MTEQDVSKAVVQVITESLKLFGDDGDERNNWMAERIVEYLELHMRRYGVDLTYHLNGDGLMFYSNTD
jgi:hypothetical protein